LSTNRDFRNIIPFDKIYGVVIQNFNSKPIESIKLEYCEKVNSFCWLVTEDYEPQVQKEIGENTFEVIGDNYTIELMYINAQTGKVVKRENETGFIHWDLKLKPLTMYKNNSRDSSKFKGFSPLQLSCNLKGKCHAIGYYSYTQRCGALNNQRKSL